MNFSNWQLQLILLLLGAACFSACNRLSSHDRILIEKQDEIVAAAQDKCPVFKAFSGKFDNTQSFISYITGGQGEPTWTSKAPLFERYVIDMNVPVVIDSKTFEVTPKEPVQIEIREITEIGQLPDGRAQVLYGKTQRLNASQITRLLESSATLEDLGIVLDSHRPVSGFRDVLAY